MGSIHCGLCIFAIPFLIIYMYMMLFLQLSVRNISAKKLGRLTTRMESATNFSQNPFLGDKRGRVAQERLAFCCLYEMPGSSSLLQIVSIISNDLNADYDENALDMQLLIFYWII